MDVNLRRRARERAIASEIANELYRELGPILPEMLATKNAVIHKVFADAFDFHSVTDEPSAGRILAHVPKALAGHNLKFAELQRRLDAAVRPPIS
jgi:hypothetical protein